MRKKRKVTTFSCSLCGQAGLTSAAALAHLATCPSRQKVASKARVPVPRRSGTPLEDRRCYGVKVAQHSFWHKHAFALLPTRATANRVRRTLQELDRRIAGRKLSREITPEERPALAELASTEKEKRVSPADIVTWFLGAVRAEKGESQVTWARSRKGGDARRK